MIRLYRASDLPPDIPGMIITDGEDTALLLNPAYAETHGAAEAREVGNSLLAALDARQSRQEASV